MDRVTTFSAYNSVISNLMKAEMRQNDANVQISSGKIADDLKGFGVGAETLTAARALKTKVEGFTTTAKTLQAKLDAQNLALTQVEDTSREARDAVANAIATGRADGLMAAMDSYFGKASAALNTQYNGHYLFAGGKVDTKPVNSDGTFNNDQLASTAQLDEATTLRTGMLASDVGTNLFAAFGTIDTFDAGAGGPFSGRLTAAQETFLTGMLQTFDSVGQELTNVVASNGLLQNRVDESLATQQDRDKVLEVMIGNITDVDMAEAASRLSQSQVALEASAHIFASLQNSSLLNYLK